MVKKVILIVLGLFALLGGLVLALIGTAALALGGRAGTIQSGYHAIQTPTVALVSDPAKVRSSTNTELRNGTATLRISGLGVNQPVFIGVGPASQVDAYLAGAPYDVVSELNFSPYRLTTRRIDGNIQPALPGDQSFWVAQASGTAPQLTWSIGNGDYRVVVMNVDASPGVALDARIGLKIPALYGVGLGMLIAGILLVLIGIALIIWGIRARARTPSAIPNYAGYPAGPAGQYGYPAGAYQPVPPSTPNAGPGPAPGSTPNAGPGPVSGSTPNAGPGPVPGYSPNPMPGPTTPMPGLPMPNLPTPPNLPTSNPPTNPMPGLSPQQPPNTLPGLPPNQPPNQGPTQWPDQGSTQWPDQGPTSEPDQRPTQWPDQGPTSQPDQGPTSEPDQGQAQEPTPPEPPRS